MLEIQARVRLDRTAWLDCFRRSLRSGGGVIGLCGYGLPAGHCGAAWHGVACAPLLLRLCLLVIFRMKPE